MNAPSFPSSVQRARTLVRPRPSETGGIFDVPRVKGRVVEVSEARNGGSLTGLCGLMLQFQQRGEAIAWVCPGATVFFPPDLAFRGLDVEALIVVWTPGSREAFQAADVLLRSGAFGLVVVDRVEGGVEESILGRLARLVEDHESTVVFLTVKKDDAPSLGTQISLRGVVRNGPEGVTFEVVKDKRSGPPSRQTVKYHGPFGLY